MKNTILTIIIAIGLLPMREHPPSIQISGARATPESFAGHQDLGFFQVSTLSTTIVMIMVTTIVLIMITTIVHDHDHRLCHDHDHHHHHDHDHRHKNVFHPPEGEQIEAASKNWPSLLFCLEARSISPSWQIAMHSYHHRFLNDGFGEKMIILQQEHLN